MTEITEIIERSENADDCERLERILLIVEEYGLEVIFSIILSQKFDWPFDSSYERNLQFIDGLSYSSKLMITELMEGAFLDMEEIRREQTH